MDYTGYSQNQDGDWSVKVNCTNGSGAAGGSRRMTLKVTERDKKILLVLAVFLIVFGLIAGVPDAPDGKYAEAG